MHINYADVEEPALDPQPAHSLVDRPPSDHTLLHLPHHHKSCSQLVFVTAALVYGVVPAKDPHSRPLPTHLLQRYDVEPAVSHYIG